MLATTFFTGEVDVAFFTDVVFFVGGDVSIWMEYQNPRGGILLGPRVRAL